MLAPQTLPQKHVAMDDLYEYLQRSRLFSCLSDSQTHELVQASTVRRLPPRASINVSADQNRTVHLMMVGRAKVCYWTPDGKEPILYFVGPDELVGEQSIFSGESHEDVVETLESSLIATIPTTLLRSLALGEPAFTTSLSELISRRRKKSESRIRHLLFLSNRDRLTHLLLDLAEQHGTGTATHLDLDIKLSHQDLANFIGSTRETVTVVLGKMQAEGLLRVKRRRITLLDAATLGKAVNRRLPFVSG